MSTTNDTLALSLTPATAAFQTSLFLLLILLGLLGNGSICFFVLRFKSLRTIPNILLTNLAAVDLLNIIINVPLSISSLVYNVKALCTKSASLWIFLANGLSVQLNLASMLLLVVDRYLSLAHPIRYMVWKSRSKMFRALGAAWIWSLFVTGFTLFFLKDIDLGEKSLSYYIKAYSTGMSFKIYVMPWYIIILGVTIVASSFTVREVLRKRVRKTNQNSPQINACPRGKTSNGVKSARTIMIVLFVYIVCFAGRSLFIFVFFHSNEYLQWYIFLALVFGFCGSICNSFIYGARSSEFRKAWKEIFKLNKNSKNQVYDGQVKTQGKVFYINDVFGKKVVIIH